jgi:hypothetical protein
MSNGPQAATAIAYVSRLFETNSARVANPESATAIASPSVLLVGRSGSWGTSVLKSLSNLRSDLVYAVPNSVTSKYVKANAFDLILLDSTVSPEQRRQIVSDLLGTAASVFYTFPVENGCWWLPTLRRGQDCHGAPAFRHNEFAMELERILRDETPA